MSRAVARSAEMGIRAALGARTSQLVRLVFAECLTLGVFGAGAGVVVALWGHALLVRGLV